MNNNENKKPYLAWKLEDYQDANEEAPSILFDFPEKTEGELMSEEDLANWVIDTRKTFRVVRDQDAEVFNRLYQDFILDVEYLTKIGKIDEDTADEILNLEDSGE